MASAKRPLVYIVSVYKGLADLVRSKLPHANIKELKPENNGVLSEPGLSEVRQNAEVVFSDLPLIADIMYNNSKLKWAHSTWAGVDAIMKKVDPDKPQPDITITRSGHGFGGVMAEYVLTYILSLERSLPQMYSDQQQRVWNPDKFNSKSRLLAELRLGIIGAGQIGREICRTCKLAGMEVWGLSRTPKPVGSEAWEYDVHMTMEELPRLLENCDYICSVLPNTPATTDLLSGDVFSHCKTRKSVFINVGRGNVVSEESLVSAITNEWISAAVLDVFRTEPLPQDSKLWSLPNVYITPHISGPTQPKAVAETFVKNYDKFVNGEKLEFEINWQDGY